MTPVRQACRVFNNSLIYCFNCLIKVSGVFCFGRYLSGVFPFLMP
ncbi:hypothetical protein BAZMOX_239599_2 [methanotrophic endosymbiont of Bathymodiolus azoricus (Menez Gwen)]|nr:hypothetical protein BAZMOX_239599_2 [methanotrophic endosymbiont of Bathymodiolus azoricus (Menez Gwen)]